MHPPGVDEGTWFNVVMTGIGTITGTAVFALVRGWRSYRAPEAAPASQHYVLERAELANLGDLPRQFREIGPKLDQIFAIDQSNKSMLGENNDYLRENNILMRRMLEALEGIKQDGALRNRREDMQELTRVTTEAALKLVEAKLGDAKKV